MNLTKSRLKQLIKEELDNVVKEQMQMKKPKPPTKHEAAFWDQIRRGSRWVPEWAEVLREPYQNVDEGNRLSVFLQLLLAIMGPQGFWRQTVPEKWLGCPQNPELPPCRWLKAQGAHWIHADGHIETIEHAQDKDAGGQSRFLRKNARSFTTYLIKFMPDEASDSAMKQTPFGALLVRDGKLGAPEEGSF